MEKTGFEIMSGFTDWTIKKMGDRFCASKMSGTRGGGGQVTANDSYYG